MRKSGDLEYGEVVEDWTALDPRTLTVLGNSMEADDSGESGCGHGTEVTWLQVWPMALW